LGLPCKKGLIDRDEQDISVHKQCELLDLPRSSYYYKPRQRYTTTDLGILKKIDEVFNDYPFYGHRRIKHVLKKCGYDMSNYRVLEYMKILGMEAMYPKKKHLSLSDREHKIYPYLLKEIEITKPNGVWSADITYIRLIGGFCYLIGIIDWYSRYVLSYKLSNSLDVYFCNEAYSEAIEKYGAPEILNTDQGSQFSSHEFTKISLDRGIKISMDSVGRALDNIVIERFFRSLKYENIYIYEYDDMRSVNKGVGKYISFYNNERMHMSLDYKTPSEVYFKM
jgi:putative transposase